MNELRLPPDTPIQYEEGLWELCTDRAYEMMRHRKSSLDADKLASDTGYSKNLFHLYNMIIEIKELLMEGITTTENVQCLFDSVPYEHEGYVMSNKYGTFKLVKRQQFSYANFNNRQFR